MNLKLEILDDFVLLGHRQARIKVLADMFPLFPLHHFLLKIGNEVYWTLVQYRLIVVGLRYARGVDHKIHDPKLEIREQL